METEIFNDLIDGISFKFKDLNPIELINLVSKNIDFGKSEKYDEDEKFIRKVLLNVLWSKDGATWIPLIQEDGTERLPELKTNKTVSLDLFYRFRSKVLAPVFYESKTFQNLMKETKTKKIEK